MEEMTQYKSNLPAEIPNFWQAIGEFNKQYFDEKPKNTRKHKTQGFEYIPIEQIEADLDSIFNGQWEYYDFTYQAIGNEITGSLTLRFFHPVSKQWLRRVGAGAVQVRFKKDTDILDIRNKITTALQMDLPHLKSECLKNAVQSIGRIFGRNLRREEDIEIEEIYKPAPEYPEDVKKIIEGIKIAPTKLKLADYWAEFEEKLKTNPNFNQFTEDIKQTYIKRNTELKKNAK